MRLIDLTIPPGIATLSWPNHELLQIRFKQCIPSGADYPLPAHLDSICAQPDGGFSIGHRAALVVADEAEGRTARKATWLPTHLDDRRDPKHSDRIEEYTR